MSKLKYKEGDPVEIAGAAGNDEKYNGMTGIIIVAQTSGVDDYPYLVELKHGMRIWFKESELKLAYKFTEGEEVEVSLDEVDWHKRIYLFTDKNNRHITVTGHSRKRYIEGAKGYDVFIWYHIRKIEAPQIEMTAKINGKTVPLKDISADTFAKLQEAE